jgi:hypothetical protein
MAYSMKGNLDSATAGPSWNITQKKVGIICKNHLNVT